MMHFIKRLLGWECCKGGEWTQWETLRATYVRPHKNMVEKVVAGTDQHVFTKRWQERRCTLCGRIQQRELDL